MKVGMIPPLYPTAGPLGVMFGGLAGGTIGTAVENIATTPKLEAEPMKILMRIYSIQHISC